MSSPAARMTLPAMSLTSASLGTGSSESSAIAAASSGDATASRMMSLRIPTAPEIAGSAVGHGSVRAQLEESLAGGNGPGGSFTRGSTVGTRQDVAECASRAPSASLGMQQTASLSCRSVRTRPCSQSSRSCGAGSGRGAESAAASACSCPMVSRARASSGSIRLLAVAVMAMCTGRRLPPGGLSLSCLPVSGGGWTASTSSSSPRLSRSPTEARRRLAAEPLSSSDSLVGLTRHRTSPWKTCGSSPDLNTTRHRARSPGASSPSLGVISRRPSRQPASGARRSRSQLKLIGRSHVLETTTVRRWRALIGMEPRLSTSALREPMAPGTLIRGARWKDFHSVRSSNSPGSPSCLE
mmetsp:Transcript_14427/g.34178  ORF Transcript_14427/g.34178 Transcript_14427/m.34178 type:complete len:354 (-) Transcript_14427:1096-2157(-)